ncbi:MAG: NAD+ diphosphatase [Verrucomicrobiales bacterium]|jgi:NAD+ diphosphatase
MTPKAVKAVQALQFCPGCARATRLGDADAKKFTCADCGFLLYFNPGSAVAALLPAPDGRVLFLRRERDPGKGKLGLPGGFIDPGESAEQALSREVMEETGLQVEQWRYLISFPNIYDFRGITYNVTDMFFVSSVESFDSIDLDTSESADWHAMDPEKALQNETFAFNSNRKAVEAFVRNRAASNEAAPETRKERSAGC